MTQHPGVMTQHPVLTGLTAAASQHGMYNVMTQHTGVTTQHPGNCLVIHIVMTQQRHRHGNGPGMLCARKELRLAIAL